MLKINILCAKNLKYEGVKMELNFKQAEPSDLQQVLLLFKTAAENLQKRHIDQWQYWLNPTAKLLERVEKDLQDKRFFLVENEEKLVGMFRLMETDEEYWGKNDVVARYVHSFVTLPEYAGQGIGSKVLKMIEQQVAAQNVPILRLDCKADNVDLCQYYERQGFMRVCLQETLHSTNQLFEKSLNI